MRILIAEDDPDIGAAMRDGLQRLGMAVDWVQDGAAALTSLRAEHFDVLVLDIGLPRQDGHAVLRAARSQGLDLPVLLVTARDTTREKVQGLDEGADDYLVKPFDLDELAARIRALHRRRGGRAVPCIVHRGVSLDPGTREVQLDGAPVPLAPREFALLHALLERPGQVLSRAQLEERLYGWDEAVESNAVDVHLHGLRRKLGAAYILNVRGVGWRVAP